MGQFRALAKKNWILYRRNFIGSLLQLLIPTVLMLFTILTRHLATITEYQPHSNLNNAVTFYGTPDSLSGYLLANCSTNQIIAIAPENDSMAIDLVNILRTLSTTVKTYPSDAAIDAIIRDQSYGTTNSPFCYGVSFDNSGSNYKYNLRFNVSKKQAPRTTSLTIDPLVDATQFLQLLNSGFLDITTIINNLILKQEVGASLINKVGIIYTQKYTDDPIFTYFGNSLQFINLFPLLLIYLLQTSSMLKQKQKKIRQSMSITGMKLWIYFTTWFIRYFVIYLIVHLINTLIVCSSFPYIPFHVALITYLLFDIVLIVQSFFIQIFVTRSKIGIILALVFFVVQYAINFAVSSNPNVTQRINSFASIVPHVAYVLAFRSMIYGTSLQMTLNFSTVFNNYTIKTAIISFICNIIFWSAIAWYLDKVFPNEWGAKKNVCFCFKCKKKNQDNDPQISSQKLIENQKRIKENKIIPQQIRPGSSLSISNEEQKKEKIIKPQIQEVEQKYKEMQQNNKALIIKNLNKKFDENHAVRNLNITMYSDQIFVLLGHNGAGKTTTISMLTGMIQPTSGIIQVMGATELEDIRSMLGVCPQHDTLYDELTVEEHLRLFATFRGLEGQELEAQVKKLIKDVNLSQKRREFSKNLSGGQKRRLSVAIAFAGAAKVIILDEPTSGMDTSARRYIWQMLKNYKTNRIIILTTHFMDEADYLGDRIAIMANGQLMALGSNIFLKNKFGMGYNFTLVKKNILIKSQPILECVKKYIANAKTLTNVSAELSIQLPLNEVKKFPPLFKEINSRKQQFGIQTYGISITTLEQVFLRIIDTQKKQEKKVQNVSQFVQQVQSPSYRNERKSKDAVARVSEQASEESILDEQKWEREDGYCERFFSHFRATILKRLRVVKRDLKSFIFELILPMAVIILAILLMRISFVRDFPSMNMDYSTYIQQLKSVTLPIGESSASSILTNIATAVNNKYNNQLQVLSCNQTTDVLFDEQCLLNLKLQQPNLPGGIFFNGYNNTSLQITSIMNTKVPSSGVGVQTLAVQAYINTQNKSISITPVNKPFPMTHRQLQINNAISGFFASLIFSIAFAFKFASIVSFIVKQREDNSKHQQIVSGLNLGSYWIGNYVNDFILFMVLVIFSLIICKALSITVLTDNGAFLPTVLLFILFGFSNISLTYILGYLFKDYGNAQGSVYFFNFVSGGIAPMLILVLRMLGSGSSSVGRGLAWVFRLVPSFSFGQGLLNIASIQLLSAMENNGKNYKPMDLEISLAPILYLVVVGCLFLILVFVIEYIRSNEKIMRKFTSQDNYTETNVIQQPDVLDQQKKSLQASPETYQILTKNLRKVYIVENKNKHKVAVDNVSFGITKGEVFGLLGVNGAGKSTTFKMLAGEVVSTSGQCFFMGMKISDNLSEIRKNLGYCPQFDALIQNLTVREQLQLFYDMKCLPKRYKKRAIDQKIKQLNLTEHENKLSGALSGGNKRKLSVAMAMIGNPSILFLDEPSTGMDPQARRFMWKIISRISTQKKLSTVILTTHSMEEAEALATRIAIMVEGNFKCIGTPQHIKSKYGKGFQIQVKVKTIKKQQTQEIAKDHNLSKTEVNRQNMKQILEKMQVNEDIIKEIDKNKKGSHIWTQIQLQKQSISINILISFILLQDRINTILNVLKKINNQVEIIQNFQTYVRFKIGMEVSVGKLFELLEDKKEQLRISQYSIKQATVEQIFNNFADEIEDYQSQK